MAEYQGSRARQAGGPIIEERSKKGGVLGVIAIEVISEGVLELE